MDPAQVQKFVEQLYLEKKIPREKVFEIIEDALKTVAKRHAGPDAEIAVHIDRETCEISVFRDNVPLSAAEITERLGALTARQIIMQKIRDAEKDKIYSEYYDLLDDLVSGVVRREEKNITFVYLQENVEAILPRSERVPSESFKEGDRIEAQVIEVNKNGNNAKVRIVLSRNRTSFLRRLMEQQIPEINEGIIEIKEVSRDPGHRSKVAVTCSDPNLDLVGACVGRNGSRIRAVKEELRTQEQIDIIPWHPDPAEFIKNALQPAEILDVIPCSILGRAFVQVNEDQRSKAIGRRGQNVRLASLLCSWDIEILTPEELQKILDDSVALFKTVPGMTDELIDRIVGEGFTSYDDLSCIEPELLMEFGKLSEEEAQTIIDEAERRAELGNALNSASEAAEAADQAVKDAEASVKAAEEAVRAFNAGETPAPPAAARGKKTREGEAKPKEPDFKEAIAFIRNARDAWARAKKAAEEAVKSAEIVDSSEVAKAAQEAKASAARAGRAVETASAALDSLRGGDSHRGQNLPGSPK